MTTDSELFHQYLETRSEAAFSELVRRHLPLVYSAALRQVNDNPHLAKEVAQAAFTVMAQKAATLRQHPAIGGWLHTTVYHTAAKLRRSEGRRLQRETEAQNMTEITQHQSSDDWDSIRPVIDEAMQSLSGKDRTAVVLRFFDNKPYGEIGVQLGLSENAARMRVDRALEALRSSLGRRGIVSTAAALGAALAVHASAVPPAGLAAAISAGAVTSVAGGGIALFMSSTIVKSGLVAGLLLAGSAGYWVGHRETAELRARNERLEVELARAKSTSASAVRSVNAINQTAIAALRAQVSNDQTTAAKSWQDRADSLRRLVAKSPSLGIPELKLATEEDWLDAAKGKLDTEEDYRRALANLRMIVTNRFARELQTNLRQYMSDNGGKFPTDASQLAAYLGDDGSILSHWQVVAAANVKNVRMGGDVILTQTAPVDADYDSQFVVGPRGFGSTSYHATVASQDMNQVIKAFSAANPGKAPTDPSQLLPYATTPEQIAVVQKAMGQGK